MKCGYFNDQSKEYIITTPFTPIKWCNYVGTLGFGGIVDHTGGVLLCKEDPALNRITKYIAQMPASDFKGSTLYIRFKDAIGDYQLFAPFFVPVLKNLDRFECRIGLSYSTFVSEYKGLRIEVTIFVPTAADVLLHDIKVFNTTAAPIEVDVIPVVEFTHFDALKQLTNADWVPQTMTLKAHADGEFTVLEQYAYMKRDSAINYFTANRPISSFDGDRRRFLGLNEYGSFSNPLALQESELTNSECIRGDNIGALMIHLGPILSGENARVVTQLGQAATLSAAAPTMQNYRDEAVVTAAFQELANFWDNYLKAQEVCTPDAAFNSMVNIHNPRQCHTTKNWSRYLSLYQLGYGSRGIGYRDSSQDLIGVMAHMPEEAITLALKILAVQKQNGSAMHQFNPLNMIATQGDAHEDDERPQYYGDDHLWPILTFCAYIKETGDLAILDRSIAFYEKDKHGEPLETASVWEHLVRAIEFTWGDRGRHGLPLLGFADWNDTVNLRKGAESLMVASLFGKAICDFIPVCEAYGKTEFKERIIGYYETMKAAVNLLAWDGEWYVRYFDENGVALGSKNNEKGKIWVNGQSWPILAGYADSLRRTKALESVHKHLNTKFGIKLSSPGYNGYNEKIGGITTYPPGAKENGGIFLHSNPWAIIAETMAGNGDRAYQYYNQINPAAKNDLIDIFESEPYCYPQNILGDEHPQFGLARNAWLSGTAPWTYVAASQYILGIRPEMAGLRLDPCIPKDWDGFTLKRRFRGGLYEITVRNPNGRSHGVRELVVNGKTIAGNLAPIFNSGSHLIEAVLS